TRVNAARRRLVALLKERSRPSVRVYAATTTRPAAARRMGLPDGRGLPWLLTGLLFLAGIGLLVWGFGLRSELDAVRANLADESAQLALVRANANATAYTLIPTAEGPELARGTAFIRPEGSGVVEIVNLPPLDATQRYQLWYYPEGDGAPLPGETLTLNEDSIAFSLIPADVGTFRAVGVSVEPAAGSQAPTTPIILLGTVGGARG
ncbi:MAG: anti-sigma factor, partial [Chloroflexota bacterium]|nr:anti-sigma factor [Chloroflexota bacterium]